MMKALDIFVNLHLIIHPDGEEGPDGTYTLVDHDFVAAIWCVVSSFSLASKLPFKIRLVQKYMFVILVAICCLQVIASIFCRVLWEIYPCFVELWNSFQLGIELGISRNLVALFEDGNEVAFIARYRRHLTGNASPDDLRHALDAFNTAKYAKSPFL